MRGLKAESDFEEMARWERCQIGGTCDLLSVSWSYTWILGLEWYMMSLPSRVDWGLFRDHDRIQDYHHQNSKVPKIPSVEDM